VKIFLDSVGCKLNQSEIERFATQFRMAGHELVATAEDSDLVVINTCTVTSAAAADSRSRARQAYRSKPESEIVLTGCWSTLSPSEALQLPGIRTTISNKDKDRLVPIVLEQPEAAFDREPMRRRPIPGGRMRTRAFIKAQDGCDNHCTFCLTTIARGDSKSEPLERILSEIRAAIEGGVQEVVLTGVQLSSYGTGLFQEINLSGLVRAILVHTDIPRLRLSSLEPWNLPNDFFQLWENPRLCRHLHLPLQSGSGTTLRRMARPITPAQYEELIASARKQIPDLAVTTDIIVGFPGETDEEFNESIAFVESMKFSDAHVFQYSPRTGTAAPKLPGDVPNNVAKSRSQRVRLVISQAAKEYRRRFAGTTLMALWESVSSVDQYGWKMKGITDNYLRVSATVPKDLSNTITPVKVLETNNPPIPVEVEVPA
jgi:threonylcarbamoyladenosine tRNA methylthiotransferase MtaB